MLTFRSSFRPTRREATGPYARPYSRLLRERRHGHSKYRNHRRRRRFDRRHGKCCPAGMNEIPGLRLVSNGGNRGRDYSVRHGMLDARGRITLFAHADPSSPIEESRQLLTAIETGNDLAISSRTVGRTLIDVHQSRFREIAGIIFNGFVKPFTGLPFHDTECGFKAFLRTHRGLSSNSSGSKDSDSTQRAFSSRTGTACARQRYQFTLSHDKATRVHVFRDRTPSAQKGLFKDGTATSCSSHPSLTEAFAHSTGDRLQPSYNDPTSPSRDSA